MSRAVRPLTPEDIPELGRFLAAGFHADPTADFAAAEVLRWKYLRPENPAPAGCSVGNDEADVSEPDLPRSYVACDEAGRIVGHLGLCRTAFEGKALASAGGRVSTIHIIDWLGSPEHKAVGMSLMRPGRTCRVATQFGLGVSQAALVVGERAGYDLRSLVPVYTRVLRAGYWLRAGGLSPWRRGMSMARDAASRLIRPTRSPRSAIVLRRVSAFGPEIVPIVESAKERAILTSRDPARLNAFLDFPRQSMSGWHLVDETGRLRGLAVLNVIPKDGGRTRTGKVVDFVRRRCWTWISGTWPSHGLTGELPCQGQPTWPRRMPARPGPSRQAQAGADTPRATRSSSTSATARD